MLSFTRYSSRLLKAFQVKSEYGLSKRFLANLEEPDYKVKTDNTVDPKTIHVPYLRDNVKQEIYRLYKNNPNIWTVSKLSQKFGTSMERTKAVLYLMSNRERVMQEEQVLDIPTIWKEMFEKYTKDPKTNTFEVLSEEFSLPESEIGSIVERMTKHAHRSTMVSGMEALWTQALDEFEDTGVDTRFRETQADSDSAKGEKFPELFGDDGYEEARARLRRRIERETRAGQAQSSHTQSTLGRILDKLDGVPPAQTQLTAGEGSGMGAAADEGVEDFTALLLSERNRRYEEHFASILVPYAKRLAEAEAAKNQTPSPSESLDAANEELPPTFCRWKFAFRDLSKGADGANALGGNRRQRRANSSRTRGSALDPEVTPTPTLICTRSGRLRPATPLEEVGRSWGRKPGYLDLALHARSPQLAGMRDVDGDEELLRRKLEAKKLRREAMSAQQSAGSKS